MIVEVTNGPFIPLINLLTLNVILLIMEYKIHQKKKKLLWGCFNVEINDCPQVVTAKWFFWQHF